ncbi:uncharacterized protein SOCE836_083810 [Sorangium cellulosum]|uniref:Uncharacterized protein n=1 Tax=Sorangium cellulosum TaxID=56 RepID=A0A4P2R022_SORCE|nr:uncharacterized protein SOCE836_083810 [Sorangium cellulosum]WCQ95477.1 hypothetical protein NQZ70_08253 [Sorangium sp. Soce836]
MSLSTVLRVLGRNDGEVRSVLRAGSLRKGLCARLAALASRR